MISTIPGTNYMVAIMPKYAAQQGIVYWVYLIVDHASHGCTRFPAFTLNMALLHGHVYASSMQFLDEKRKTMDIIEICFSFIQRVPKIVLLIKMANISIPIIFPL